MNFFGAKKIARTKTMKKKTPNNLRLQNINPNFKY
ncbi:hypothetical protein SGRA_0405 [Saprospira grandis str. Lewin]|uniref:Uncharacterized protein n=1 Tax=Saprospira grandis (strain Lewin) TaxID=984262 RepID=H6L908_SAPGL|nr:hypothetical protein SGRA_0405 [Saprospira grandis str. Lewin]